MANGTLVGNRSASDYVQALDAALQRGRLLFDQFPVAAFASDLDGRLFEWNQSAYLLFGSDLDAHSGCNIIETFVQAQSQRQALSLLEGTREGQRGQNADLAMTSLGGKDFFGRVSIVPISCAPHDSASVAIWAIIDITLEMEALSLFEAEISRIADSATRVETLAYTDPLTGIPNHRALQERLQAALRSSLYCNQPLSVAMVDIDHFKRVNDTFGHSAGDTVLKQLASILQAGCRGNDLVGRIGGEEFCLILPKVKASTAVQVLGRLRKAIENMPTPFGKITASFGVAQAGPDVLNPEDLLGRADRALYAAKSGGRNQVIAWDQLSERACNSISAEQWLQLIEVTRVDLTGQSNQRMIQQTIYDHLGWKNRLRAYLKGESSFDRSTLVSHRNCRLGIWYGSVGQERFGERADFVAIDRPHETLHKRATEIVDLFESGHSDLAEAHLRDLERASIEIVGHLDALLRA